MKAAVVLVVVVAAAAALPVHWLELESAKTLQNDQTTTRLGDVYKFCNKSLDPLVITGVALSPDPPQEGKLLTITVSYTLTETVTGGTIKVDAELDNVPLYNGSVDLCDILAQVGENCPIDPTSARNTTTVSIPVVRGNFKASAVATDENGNELVCITVDFKL